MWIVRRIVPDGYTEDAGVFDNRQEADVFVKESAEMGLVAWVEALPPRK